MLRLHVVDLRLPAADVQAVTAVALRLDPDDVGRGAAQHGAIARVGSKAHVAKLAHRALSAGAEPGAETDDLSALRAVTTDDRGAELAAVNHAHAGAVAAPQDGKPVEIQPDRLGTRFCPDDQAVGRAAIAYHRVARQEPRIGDHHVAATTRHSRTLDVVTAGGKAEPRGGENEKRA